MGFADSCFGTCETKIRAAKFQIAALKIQRSKLRWWNVFKKFSIDCDIAGLEAEAERWNDEWWKLTY